MVTCLSLKVRPKVVCNFRHVGGFNWPAEMMPEGSVMRDDSHVLFGGVN